MRKYLNYFTTTEKLLWLLCVSMVLFSFLHYSKDSYLSLIASLIGVTSLLFNAKGNPFGQILTVIFSLLYGIISYSFSYYGEMVTYLGMTMPMAMLAFISWMKNPYKGNKSEVTIHHLVKKEIQEMFIYTILVTIVFFFILTYFHTTNLYLSTLSVTTSFMAVYMTYKRSPYYAISYACNDLILIGLWIYASLRDVSYISVVVCFFSFLLNDLYAFFNWKRIQVRQGR